MIVSKKWLSEFVDLKKVSNEALAAMLTDRGIEVESVTDLSQGFEEVVSVEIVEKKKHPDADRLSVCQVRQKSNGPTLEIVCGATNMKEGDRVALAQVGAQLPNGMEIKKSSIRGVTSYGMLCSESELGLAEESEGILILPEGTPIGKNVGKILGRDDVVFELGITPNRGDCLSHLGVARELAAGLNTSIQKDATKDLKKTKLSIQTKIEVGADAPQFYGCLIEGVQVGPSPAWLVRRLEAIGLRSINNVVDATNAILMERGQPTHAYDADLIQSGTLSASVSKKGQKLQLLDDSEVVLSGEELVISDGGKPVALAGVMGGAETAVSDRTQNIFLECAEFSPMKTRRSAQRHQKFSDSSQRFEKGIDSAAVPRALARLAGLVVKLAGGKIVGATSAKMGSSIKRKAISFRPEQVGQFLGIDLNAREMERILKGLGCEISKKSQRWDVRPPSWRNDLSIEADLAEEIARSVGYEKIPSTLPPLRTTPKNRLEEPAFQRSRRMFRAKESLRRLGFLETVQYSFCSREWLEKFQMSSEVSVQNPISEEQEVLVPSLLPGLIKAIVENESRTFGSEPPSVRLFEIRPTFLAEKVGAVGEKKEGLTGVQEHWKLAWALSGQRYQTALRVDQTTVDFWDHKSVLEQVGQAVGARGLRLGEIPSVSICHRGQSAGILLGKETIGWVGRLHPRIQKKFKIRQPVWLGELDWEKIDSASRRTPMRPRFQAWSPYPSIERDFALHVRKGTPAEKIRDLALRRGKPLATNARVFDIYEGSQVPEGMTSVAVRVIFSSEQRSLKEAEADEVTQKILSAWKGELGAELRS